MPARFLFLDNDGSPTRWNGTRYFKYLKRIRARLPSDLQSLTSKERFDLPSGSELSLWLADVTYIRASGDEIEIWATNDYGTRRFQFIYSGVRKLQTTSRRLYFKPALVVQELVQLRNGVLRHTFSDMRGDTTTIHALSLSFQESRIQ